MHETRLLQQTNSSASCSTLFEELPQNRNTAQFAEERRSSNRFHYQTRAAPSYTTSAATRETCSRAIRQSLIRRGRMARTPSLPYAEDSKKSDKQERVKRRMCYFYHLSQLSMYPEAGRNSKVRCRSFSLTSSGAEEFRFRALTLRGSKARLF